MVQYRRSKLASVEAMYFLTLGTHNHRSCFARRSDYVLLWRVMQRISDRFGCRFDAWVMLPDRLHWLLSPRRADYSKIVFAYKRGVGAELKRQKLLPTGGRIWQAGFWEQTIRDEDDLRRCVDYIHFNAVKHGHADSPADWPYSSFRQFVREGLYALDWRGDPRIVVDGSEWDVTR